MRATSTFFFAAAIAVAQANPVYHNNGTSSAPPSSLHPSSSLPPSSIPHSSSAHPSSYSSHPSSYSSKPSSVSSKPSSVSSKPSSVSSKPPSSSSYPPVSSKTNDCKTFTVVTTVPVIYSKYAASSVTKSTSYTTKTITSTSCKDGHHHPPTDKPGRPTDKPGPPSVTGHEPYPPHPPHPTGTVTVTTTITSFVKCSTPVIEHGSTIYYSTWLTPTYIPSTYVTVYPQPTSAACPPAVTIIKTVTVTAQPTGHGGHGGYGWGHGGHGGNNGGHGGNNGGNGGHPPGKPTGKPPGPPHSSKPTPSGTGTPPRGTGNVSSSAVHSSVYHQPTLSAKW